MLRSLFTLTFVLPLSFAVAQEEPTLAAPPKPSELPQEVAPVPSEAGDSAPVEPAAPPKPLIGVRERVALGLLRQFVPAERQRSFDNVVETLQEVAEQVDGVRGVGRTDVRPSGVVQAEARTRKPTRRQRRVQQNGQPMPTLGEPVDPAGKEIEQVAGRVQEDGVSLDREKPAPAKVGPARKTLGPTEAQGILGSNMYKVDKDVQELLKRLESRLGPKEQLDDHGLPRFQHSHPTQPYGPMIRHGHPGLTTTQNNAAIKKLLAERDHLRAMLEKARKAEADAKKLSAVAKHKAQSKTGHENPFRGQPSPDRDEHHDNADHDHADHEHSHESDHAKEQRGHDIHDAQRREHEAHARAEAMRREQAQHRERAEFEHHMHELQRGTEIHRLDVARRELHLEQSHLRAESAADPLPVAIWAVERVIELYGDDATHALRELQPKIRNEIVRRYVTMRLAELAEDDREAAVGPLKQLILDGDDRGREQRSSNNGR